MWAFKCSGPTFLAHPVVCMWFQHASVPRQSLVWTASWLAEAVCCCVCCHHQRCAAAAAAAAGENRVASYHSALLLTSTCLSIVRVSWVVSEWTLCKILVCKMYCWLFWCFMILVTPVVNWVHIVPRLIIYLHHSLLTCSCLVTITLQFVQLYLIYRDRGAIVYISYAFI